MIPAYARPAHRRLRAKLAEIAAWNETSDLNTVDRGRPGARHHHRRASAPSTPARPRPAPASSSSA